MNTRFELYVKPNYNFLHWLRDEKNNYKGKAFWKYFLVKKISIEPKGVTVDFFEFYETGKPYIAYHYFNEKFDFEAIWNFSNYDNFNQAWHYLNVPQFYNNFSEVIDVLMIFYTKKINYLCNQVLS